MTKKNEKIKRKQKPRLQIIAYPEVCERCGKEAPMLYLWNGKWLCKECLKEEQQSWELVSGGPSGAPSRVAYPRKKGLLNSIAARVFETLELVKNKLRIQTITEPVDTNKGKKSTANHKNIVLFKYGKTYTDKLKEESKKSPSVEGLIKKKKSKKKRGA